MRRWLAVACMLAASCLGAAEVQQSSSAPVPLERFTRDDSFGGVKISPDGQMLAATAGRGGRASLIFLDLKSRKPIHSVKVENNFEILDFEWVSATRVIYFIAERQFGRLRPRPVGAIFAVDVDGKNLLKIYDSRAGKATFASPAANIGSRLYAPKSNYAMPELISTLEDDEQHILIAEYPLIERREGFFLNRDAWPSIVRLDVDRGLKKPLGTVPLRGAKILVDQHDQVRFAVGYDADSNLAAVWKPQPDAAWESFELPGFRSGTVFPQSLTADAAAVLVTGVREGESLAALYRIDLQSRDVKKLYQHTEVDVYELITSLSDGAVVGLRLDTGRPTHHWLVDDAPTVMLYKRLEGAFPGQSVEIRSKTRDGSLALVFVSSDVNPGEYYLLDSQTKKADFLLARKSWIDPRRMRPKEVVSIEARDGLVLHGYLTRPAAAGPQPLVVLPHGGPHGVRDDWSFDAQVQLLANRGYQAELRERSPVHQASRIEVPVLLLHSKDAAQVASQHAKRMKVALEAGRKPLEWLALSCEGIFTSEQETCGEVYEAVLAFLGRNLRAAPLTQSTR